MVVNHDTNPYSKPRFFKARSVSYDLKEWIEEDSNQLIVNNIYKPLQFSMWAAHNSILLKDDNSYEQMISQAPIWDK